MFSILAITADNFFDSGYFTVGESGEISIDFVYDGGWYRPFIGIFSLEEFPSVPLNNDPAFIKLCFTNKSRKAYRTRLTHEEGNMNV